MAVLDELPGVEVNIVVGDAVLKEHTDDDDQNDEKTVIRYIRATSDQEFVVRCVVKQKSILSGNCLAFKISVDGKPVDGLMISKKDVKKRDYEEKSLGLEIPGGKVRHYCFSSLETVADGKMNPSELAKAKNLGNISVEVHPKHILGHSKRGKVHYHDCEEVGMMSEKALKGQALSHSVGLSKPKREAGAVHHFRTAYVDPAKRPAATFVFRYRSLDALKSMLIIPRTPSPHPELPLEERDPATLTPAEQLEVIKRFQAQRAEQQETAKKIKRERIEDAQQQRKRARPAAEDTRVELVEDGSFREGPTALLPPRYEDIIELD